MHIAAELHRRLRATGLARMLGAAALAGADQLAGELFKTLGLPGDLAVLLLDRAESSREARVRRLEDVFDFFFGQAGAHRNREHELAVARNEHAPREFIPRGAQLAEFGVRQLFKLLSAPGGARRRT